MSRRPAFFLPFCLRALFSSTSADVGSMIDRADSSSQDKTQENISKLWILHDSHFWVWRCGRQAKTAVTYTKRNAVWLDLTNKFSCVTAMYCVNTGSKHHNTKGWRNCGYDCLSHLMRLFGSQNICSYLSTTEPPPTSRSEVKSTNHWTTNSM